MNCLSLLTRGLVNMDFQLYTLRNIKYRWYNRYIALKRACEVFWIELTGADWDHAFMLRLIEWKLGYMIRHMEHYGRHVGDAKKQQQMMFVQEILRRECNGGMEEKYRSPEENKLVDEYYDRANFTKESKDGYCRLIFPEKNKELVHKICERSEKRQEEMRVLCWKVFVKHYQSWWD